MKVDVTAKPTLNMVSLRSCTIFDQLRLEEALLRADPNNWCLFNDGTSPSIVMGISGQPEKLLSRAHMETHPLPLIRRFSGGGTVVVDSNTLFVTLIMNSHDLPAVHCYPEPILRWMGGLYKPLFKETAFNCCDQDYTIAGRKFGGNAQYLCKGRWLHHSSLLWDYDDHLMNYLLIPQRQPHYRDQRSHCDFLCRLCSYFSHKRDVQTGLKEQLGRYFQISKVSDEAAMTCLDRPHRTSTCYLDFEQNTAR